MSDRYETPSWDDEPGDLEPRSPVADVPGSPATGAEETGLDASSENVLDGWPAVDPVSLGSDDDDAAEDRDVRDGRLTRFIHSVIHSRRHSVDRGRSVHRHLVDNRVDRCPHRP